MILVGNPLLLAWDCRRKEIPFRKYAFAVILAPPWIVSIYLARTYRVRAGLLIPAYYLLILLMLGLPIALVAK